MFRDARALIFDLDGTLVDSIADIAHHLNDALAERGLPTHAPESVAQWIGEGARHLVMRAVSQATLVDEVLAAFRTRYRAHPVIHTRVYDGLPAVLDQLAPGRALCVLSNKPHDLTVQVCRALLARWPFAVIEGEQPPRLPKPDPAGVHAILGPLGIAPQDAVMIGDSEIDVMTAKRSGMTSIAVSWGLRPRALLADADALVDEPSQLASLFS
ncbi:MAG: HAD-IA family hydrolase [Deltaproteobacteria bacterium]|nr:HAD-IA family hydrolase [Deltaproteobacteria bacterium]